MVVAVRLEPRIRNAVLEAYLAKGCIQCRHSCFEVDAATD